MAVYHFLGLTQNQKSWSKTKTLSDSPFSDTGFWWTLIFFFKFKIPLKKMSLESPCNNHGNEPTMLKLHQESFKTSSLTFQWIFFSLPIPPKQQARHPFTSFLLTLNPQNFRNPFNCHIFWLMCEAFFFIFFGSKWPKHHLPPAPTRYLREELRQIALRSCLTSFLIIYFLRNHMGPRLFRLEAWFRELTLKDAILGSRFLYMILNIDL